MNKKKVDRIVKQKLSRVKKGSEDKAAYGYLHSAANNQKEAAKQINESIKGVNETFKSIIEQAPREDQAKLQHLVKDINKLLLEVKKGGNVEDIVTKIYKLK